MIRSVAEALRRYLMNRARSAGQSRDPLAESPGRSVAGVDKARRNKRARDRPPLIASGWRHNIPMGNACGRPRARFVGWSHCV